ncbi:MAG: hypothetical protein ABID40_03525 [Candidatus Bipolaricaulota bacterium]
MARFSQDLLNPYHAFAILSGTAFAATLLWPESAPEALSALMRGPFFPQAVAFLVGFLGLQVGEAEHGYGPYSPGGRVARLVGLVALGLGLILPFLLIHRVEAGLPWTRFAQILGFLAVYGLFWALAGHAAAATVHWDGLRFAIKYGSLLAVAFLPVLLGLPLSPFPTVSGLWAGTITGWWGLLLYGTLDAGAVGAWLLSTQTRSSRR